MKIYIRIALLGMILFSNHLFGQDKFPNTLSYIDSIGSPKADLNAVSWVQGHWRGEAFGGITEEVWTPPVGGSMMGAFKLVVEDQVQLYEIETITEENNSLIFRLKHFHSNLKGWEEKDKTIDFKLVKVTEDKVYFDGCTFEKISENEMNIYVILEIEGEETETKFNYHK